MLVLTDAAAEVVKALTSTLQDAEGSGLRIASSTQEPGDSGALQVSAAAGPGENDQIIEAAGAHLYLAPQAAAYLEDKVLDAQVDSEGQAHFSLGLQGSDSGQVLVPEGYATASGRQVRHWRPDTSPADVLKREQASTAGFTTPYALERP